MYSKCIFKHVQLTLINIYSPSPASSAPVQSSAAPPAPHHPDSTWSCTISLGAAVGAPSVVVETTTAVRDASYRVLAPAPHPTLRLNDLLLPLRLI